MSTFKVGEVAVAHSLVLDPDRNGMECVITGPLKMRFGKFSNGDAGEMLAYCVEWADGFKSNVRHTNLRRKRPPTTGEESILALFRQNQREGVAA